MRLSFVVTAFFLASCASQDNVRVEASESLYADLLDAAGARDTIDFGLVSEFEGRPRDTWQAQYETSLGALRGNLAAIDARRLNTINARAFAALRAGLTLHADTSPASEGDCSEAQNPAANGDALRESLYACFSQVGDSVQFEGRAYARTAALQNLEEFDDPARRRDLFMAMAPLWQAVNGDGGPTSPYRRMIALNAQRARDNIARAESSLRMAPGEAETWLVRALEAWRDNNQGAAIEPWDFRFSYAAAARALQVCTPLALVRTANDHFFADLGADLDALGVIQDIDFRPGMSPIDYADFARVGRMVGGRWRPAIPRVSVIAQQGGLGLAAQLAHEDGHAAHYAGMRGRPSMLFADDMTLVIEAIADVTGWSVYEVEWQQRYLGCSASAAANRRARLGAVMLDIAWGLFELRMSRDPARDPNATWTEITSNYLHITPHPEISWWAVRGQLVDEPGYMIHYALGAFVTAEMRARIMEDIGDFDAGNPRWFNYLSAQLFRFGGDREPADLLVDFLGGPVRSEPFIASMRSN